LPFEHLTAAHISVFKRFLAEHGKEYDHIDYDVRVGEAIPLVEFTEEEYLRMVRDLSLKRIDAVGYRKDMIDIIEIKKRADIIALGQLLAYELLYERTFHPKLPTRKVLVCETIDDDVRRVLESYNIVIYVEPPPEIELMR